MNKPEQVAREIAGIIYRHDAERINRQLGGISGLSNQSISGLGPGLSQSEQVEQNWRRYMPDAARILGIGT